MGADGLTEPGRPTRTRLLLADLVAFDPSRLNWVLALRTTLGLAVPLLLAHARSAMSGLGRARRLPAGDR